MVSAGAMAPEIIPPVTQTQGRTVPPVAVAAAKLQQHVVRAGDFVPRMTITQSAAATQHMSKPKRYSTQRQRAAPDADTAGDVPYEISNTDVPAADTTYYGTKEFGIIEFVQATELYFSVKLGDVGEFYSFQGSDRKNLSRGNLGLHWCSVFTVLQVILYKLF